MPIFKYFDGRKVIEAEANGAVADGYRELRRGEWRQDKRIERHEAKISLTQMEDENGYQLEDLSATDTLDTVIAREEREERRAVFQAVWGELTKRQTQVAKLLYAGKTVSEIARCLNLNQKTVWEIRAALQKKFKIFCGIPPKSAPDCPI